jgi:hypothetical protein
MAITRLNNNSITSITALPSGVAEDNAPAFYAYRGTGLALSNQTNTTCLFTATVFNSNSSYNTGTGLWTVPSGEGGKYYVYTNCGLENATPSRWLVRIRKNLSTDILTSEAGRGSNYENTYVGGVVELSAGDYLDVLVYHDNGGTSNMTSGIERCYFGAFKMIGI